jgi:hypothetical protein
MSDAGHGDVAVALLGLERDRKTGTLAFEAEGVTTRVFVADGVPVGADGGVLGETLGNVLIRERVITHAHFAAVVRKMTDALLDDENEEDKRFGEVLVELGILSAEGREKALAMQVEKKIVGCVARGEGSWTFSADTPPATVCRAPIRTLLVDAAKLLPEARVEALLALNRETFPVTLEPSHAIASTFGLEGDEVAIVTRLDGTTRTKDILDASDRAAPLLCALVLGQGVELLETRGAKKPPTSSESLETFGRRRSLRPPPAETIEVEIMMPEVRMPSLRPARNDREATLFSEDEFQAGKRLFAQGLFEQAHAQLVLACERSPNAPLYRLYEEFVGSRAGGRFDDVARTKALAVKMVREDPECAFAHYVLGYVALEEDAMSAAKRFFDRAFALDRELLDAGRQARRLSGGSADRAALSPAVRDVVPMRTPSKEKARSPNARLKVLVAIFALLMLGTFAYVLSARAGMWDDYQEVR